MGAVCSFCWAPEESPLNTKAAAAVAKLDPKKLETSLATLTTQINEQREIIQTKREAYDEAIRNLGKSTAEAESNPEKHTVTSLNVLKMIADMALRSYNRAQEEMASLVTKRGQIEHALSAFKDRVRREHLRSITVDVSNQIAEFTLDLRDEEEEVKDAIMGNTVSLNADADVMDAIERLKEDPTIERLVNEHKEAAVQHIARQLPSVPRDRRPPGGGGGGRMIELPVLEFASLLDPDTGVPHTPAAPRLSEDQRRKALDICADSL